MSLEVVRKPYLALTTTEKIEREQQEFDECFNSADEEPIDFNEHPLPWTARACFHDGAGIQFFDANNMPVLEEFIYHSPGTAARLLKTFNRLNNVTR